MAVPIGARVTYAMGKDEEVPEHFGMLHGKNLTPRRSIWTLAVISAVIGILTVTIYLGGTTPAPLDPKYHNIWYSLGLFNPETIAKLPNTLSSSPRPFSYFASSTDCSATAFPQSQSGPASTPPRWAPTLTRPDSLAADLSG